ncbi:MAG: DMT family transporter [Cyclobacteriaceae bacterium]
MNPYLLAVFVIFVFGSSGAFIKLIGVSPIVLTFFRTAIPTLLLFSYFSVFQRIPLFRSSVKWLLLGSLLNAGRIFLFIMSYSYTSIANAVVIYYSWPVFVTIFSRIWLGESIPRRNRFLLFLPLIGVGIIFSNQDFTAQNQDLIGMSAMLASAILYSFTVIIFKRTSYAYSGYETVFFQNLVGGILFLPFAWTSIDDYQWQTYGLIFAFVISIGVIAFGLYFHALKQMKAATLSYLSYLEVVVATGYGILFFDETLTVQLVIGASLIVLSTLLFKKG